MLSEWILIIMFTTNDAAAIRDVAFTSQQSCEVAKNQINSRKTDWRSYVLTAMCVKR